MYPSCPDFGTKLFLQAVGIVGAVLAIHEFYITPSLVKSGNIERLMREVDLSRPKAKECANMYYCGIAVLAVMVCSTLFLFHQHTLPPRMFVVGHFWL